MMRQLMQLVGSRRPYPRAAVVWCWIQLAIAAILLILGTLLWGQGPSLELRPRHQDGAVMDLIPGGAAMRAGIRLGDKIQTVNGISRRSGIPPLHDAAAGETVNVALERNGKPLVVPVRLSSQLESTWHAIRAGGLHGAEALLDLLSLPVVLLAFAIAVFLLAMRPDVPAARISALLLGYWAGSAGLLTQPGGMRLLSHFPESLAYALIVADAFFFAFIFGVAVHFALVFPEPSDRIVRRPWLKYIGYVIALPIFVESLTVTLRIASHSLRGTLPQLHFLAFTLLGSGLLITSAVILAVKLRRSSEVTVKRKIRLIFVAFAIPVAAIIVALGAVIGQAPQWVVLLTQTIYWVAVALGASLYGYAILRHRLYDIRLFVRQGLRYALARGTLIALMLLPVLNFVVFLYQHRDMSLGELFTTVPGRLLFVLVPIVLVAIYRRQLLHRLDRRFFREVYDARQILLNVVSSVRARNSVDATVMVALTEIERALHPVHISVWKHDPPTDSYICSHILIAPPSDEPLRKRGALVTLLATSDEALDFERTRAELLVRRLPQEDRDWLTQSGAQVLVPLRHGEMLLGFMLLGERRSEQPYRSEDLSLLTASAAALASRWTPLMTTTAVEVQDAAARIRGVAVCTACRRCHRPETERCEADGAPLVIEGDVPFVIDGKYELAQLLGRGGMGMVFRATQANLQRSVAVKVLLRHLLSDLTFRDRFQREARILAHLQHPSIVTVHDFGALPSGSAYLVMEYVQGNLLRDALSHDALDERQRLEVVRDIAAGVAYAHRSGVVHRDLKPDNIVVVPAGTGSHSTVKILDFGLSRIIEVDTTRQVTQAGAIFGTVPYMAPELFRGARASEATDQYALAIVAWETLAGRHPFEGSPQVAEMIYAQTHQPIPDLRTLVAVDERIASAVMRAASKEAADRFPSVAAFVEALESESGALMRP